MAWPAQHCRPATIAGVVACAVLTATACSGGDDEAGVDQTSGDDTRAGSAVALPTADTTPPEPEESTTSAVMSERVDKATAFWEALAARDREIALGFIDPALLESGAGNPWGRAETLEGQFDWYEVVGWQWAFDDCAIGNTGAVECTATASNAWSDALGVEPVTGTFRMGFGENGIGAVDALPGFGEQWSSMVFEPFAAWVVANLPDDAEVMWDEQDTNSDILELFATNTERFVEAQRDE